MGKLVLLLLLAAVGYYWHSQQQNPEQIAQPVYAEARVDLQVAGRELNMVLLGKMVDDDDCSQRGEIFWRNALQDCDQCQFIRYECKPALSDIYQPLFADQQTRTSYVKLERGNRFERDGRLLVWGLNKSDADWLCNLLKQKMKQNYSGQVSCVDGYPDA